MRRPALISVTKRRGRLLYRDERGAEVAPQPPARLAGHDDLPLVPITGRRDQLLNMGWEETVRVRLDQDRAGRSPARDMLEAEAAEDRQAVDAYQQHPTRAQGAARVGEDRRGRAYVVEHV